MESRGKGFQSGGDATSSFSSPSSSSCILSHRQLENLSLHKYSATGSTLLDPWMQKFWNWFLTKVPMTIAPNVLTLTGLIVNIVTTLILICYSPTARSEVRDKETREDVCCLCFIDCVCIACEGNPTVHKSSHHLMMMKMPRKPTVDTLKRRRERERASEDEIRAKYSLSLCVCLF